MSNIIIQGNEINAKKYLDKITIEGIGEEKSLNPRLIVAKNNMIKYSTEEQVIGTWIDGKPLYQKSFNVNVNNSSASGFTQVVTENEFGVPYSSIEKFIDVKAQVGKVVIPRIRIKSSWSENVYTSDGKINIEAAHDVSNETWSITVQYTKTTD